MKFKIVYYKWDVVVQDGTKYVSKRKGGEENKKWERVDKGWGSERFAAFEKQNLFQRS